MRAWNERLVLTLLRGRGALSRAEVARLTGLSAQTVSVIMRALEAEGLLTRGAPVRGRVGQPSVPMSLAAEGAFFLGLKIGRQSCEMVLVDFHGAVRGRRVRRHAWPDPQAALDFATLAADELVASLPEGARGRIAGMGVAMPFRLWDWAPMPGAPAGRMEAWRGVDLRADLAARHPWPVYLQNDATAACGAELVFGTSPHPGPQPGDFIHVYVGFLVGGGVVLNGSLITGRRGNAGALGSMPVRAGDGRTVQLIERASLAVLERAVVARGLSADLIWADPDHWPLDAALIASWVEGAADGIAQAGLAALAVFEFEALVIDGWMPAAIRRDLAERIRARLGGLDLAGLEPPRVIEGSLGPEARTLGAAALPLSDRFLVDRAALSSA